MKKTNLFPAIFAILCGLGMLAQWAMFILTGQVPELETEPIRIAFHLAAEGLTAFGLILSGIMILRQISIGRQLYPIVAGMLLYSVIVSPGYFAQLGQWGFVVMFLVLLLLTVMSLLVIFRSKVEYTQS
jgi:hypothetical protein